MRCTYPTHLSSIPSYFSERMASALWVTLLVELLLKVNHGSSVAPGDEDQLFCDQYIRSIGAAPTPSYSANIRVLMDSWNYQALLPPRVGAVWDQVDNDGNNPNNATTNVSCTSSDMIDRTAIACPTVCRMTVVHWLATLKAI